MPELANEGRISMPMSPSTTSDDRASIERLPAFARYDVALVLVAVAILIAFAADEVVLAPSLALIFVIPVVIAATSLGWGPSVAAVVTSVLAEDITLAANTALYSSRENLVSREISDLGCAKTDLIGRQRRYTS